MATYRQPITPTLPTATTTIPSITGKLIDPAKETLKVFLGREGTPEEIAAWTTNPQKFQTDFWKQESKQSLLDQAAADAAKRKATRETLTAEYSPLETGQKTELRTEMDAELAKAQDLLSRTLAARGLGHGGAVPAGLSDLQDKYWNALHKGELGITNASTANQLAELSNIMAGDRAATATERANYLNIIRTNAANDFATQQQNKYIKAMQDIADQNKPGPLDYIMQGIGTGADIYGAVSGANTTNVLMKMLLNTNNSQNVKTYKVAQGGWGGENGPY